jgi:ABC-2 type transport system permease protein
MTGLIRAEFLKLRTTRTVYGLFAAMLALVAFSVFSTSRDEMGVMDPSGWRSIPLAHQEFLFLAGSIVWLFILVLALRSFTDEFRHGSIVPTLLASPERRRVLVAKAVAVASTAVVFTMGAYVLALVIGVPRLGPDADTNLVTAEMASLLGKAALMSMLWAVLGVGLGLAVRHQVAAIVGSFVWIMFVETFLEDFAPAVVRYLPVHTWIAVLGPPTALVQPEEGGTALTHLTLGPFAGGLMLAAWTAAALVAGAALMRRRDIA